MTSESTIDLHATCHCKKSTLFFTVAKSKLPLPTHFCHCSICRQTHGTMSTIHTPIPQPTVDLSTFTAYKSSDKVTRWFCTICGAHMFDRAWKEGEGGPANYCVETSMVEGVGEEAWDFWAHYNISGTGDSGLAGWLRSINGKRLKVFGRMDAASEMSAEEVDALAAPRRTAQSTSADEGVEHDKDRRLLAHCHCKGVQILIAPPSSPSVFDSAPIEERITPKDKSKWYALHCFCTSCRLLSSSAITPWIFPVLSHLSLPDGSAYPASHVFGSAKKYESSPGVLRTFCGTCGATVAYQSSDRPETVDLGMGLLDVGALRLEDWVEWRTDRGGWEEDSVWPGLLASLREGLGEWEGRRKQT